MGAVRGDDERGDVVVKRLLACGVVLLAIAACAQPILMGRRQATRTSLPPSCDSVNDSSLKGYWKLDEASGNAIDDKGANDLTDNNTVGTAAGRIGAARNFTAADNEFFSIADNADLSAGDVDFTIGAWVRHGSLDAGTTPGIIAKWAGSGQSEYYLYANVASQRYHFVVSNDGSAETVLAANSAGDPADEVWHLIIAWHDATANTVNIQVDNGTVDSAAHTTGVFDGTGMFTIGGIGTSFTWTGQIDEAFVTKRVLTATERQGLYNVGNGCRPSGL